MKKYVVSGIGSIVMTALSIAIIVLSARTHAMDAPTGAAQAAIAQQR